MEEMGCEKVAIGSSAVGISLNTKSVIYLNEIYE
jgi:hypothetical protein